MDDEKEEDGGTNAWTNDEKEGTGAYTVWLVGEVDKECVALIVCILDGDNEENGVGETVVSVSSPFNDENNKVGWIVGWSLPDDDDNE